MADPIGQAGQGRTRVRRLPELAAYDAQTIRDVVDAAVVAHVGIVTPEGPVVVPMVHARIGSQLYLHGSVASRLQRHLSTGAAVCVQMTTVDGILLARSAFHTSLAYRSATVFGTARVVDTDPERITALRAFLDRLVPGHWDGVRPPSEIELRQTRLLAVDLGEASAKVSTGPPDDEADDVDPERWAGTIPLRLHAGAAEAAPDVGPEVAPPSSVQAVAGPYAPQPPEP